MRVVILLHVIVITVVRSNPQGRSFSSLSALMDSLRSRIAVHQVIALDCEESADRHEVARSLIVRKLGYSFPTLRLDVRKLIAGGSALYDESTGRLRLHDSSVLFVCTLRRREETTLEARRRFVDMLRTLSLDTSRSKYSFFHITSGEKSEERSIYEFLKLTWEEDILDAIVVEVHVDRAFDVDFKIIPLAEARRNFVTRIHWYDPFNDEYHSNLYDSESRELLFPNKLRNLRKRKLRVGFVHYPPYGHAIKDENGNYTYTAISGQLLVTLKKEMNFEIEPKVVDMSEYGVLLANGTATGLLGDIGAGKLDLIAFGAFHFYSPFDAMIDRTTHMTMEQSCAVVPMIPMESRVLSASFVSSCVAIMILISLVWLFFFVVRMSGKRVELFDMWHPLNIICLIIGIGVNERPRELFERLVYGSMMMVSLFYSSNVVAQLTSINVGKTVFVPFETFKELDDYGLIPVLHPNFCNITFGHDEEVLLRLKNKSFLTPGYFENCPKWLLNYGNVSCILEDKTAHLLIKRTNQNSRRAKKPDRIKLASPCFWSSTRGFILRKASPYTSQVNELISRVVGSGIEEYWWLDYSHRLKRLHNFSFFQDADEKLREVLKDSTYKVDFVFIVVGHALAILVFVLEIVLFELISGNGSRDSRKVYLRWPRAIELILRQAESTQ